MVDHRRHEGGQDVIGEGTSEVYAWQDVGMGQGIRVVLGRGTYRIRTNVRIAGKTPPSKGVSFGPTIRASQVKKSDSEIGPALESQLYARPRTTEEGRTRTHRPRTSRLVRL